MDKIPNEIHENLIPTEINRYHMVLSVIQQLTQTNLITGRLS